MTLQQNQPIRVLLIHRDLAFHGGVPRVLLRLARDSDPHRLQVHVASFREPPDAMVEMFARKRITPHCLGDRGYLRPIRQLRRIIRTEQIDAVVCCTFKSYLVAKAAGAGLGTAMLFWRNPSPWRLKGCRAR